MEGVADDAIGRILNHAKVHHGLTEGSLNNAIIKFRSRADYLEKYNGLPLPNMKYVSKNSSFSITATAAQTRTLHSRLLFILNLVDGFRKKQVFFSSEHFKCFSLLIKINSFLHSPCLYSSDVYDLNVLIKKYLHMSVRLYSSTSNVTNRKPRNIIKPKGHNMCHYANLIFENGPLRYYSTLCHERSMAKYKPTILSKQNPTIQIARAMRFQMFHYSNFLDTPSRLDTPGGDMSQYSFPGIDLPTTAVCHKKLRIHGMTLAPGLSVYTATPSPTWLSKASPPEFSKILLIYSICDCTYIVVQQLHVQQFSRIFMAYEVTDTLCYKIVPVNSLFFHKTFSIHEFSNKMLLFPDSLPYKEY